MRSNVNEESFKIKAIEEQLDKIKKRGEAEGFVNGANGVARAIKEHLDNHVLSSEEKLWKINEIVNQCLKRERKQQ